MRLHNGEEKSGCLYLKLYVGHRAPQTFVSLTKINVRYGVTENGCLSHCFSIDMPNSDMWNVPECIRAVIMKMPSFTGCT